MYSRVYMHTHICIYACMYTYIYVYTSFSVLQVPGAELAIACHDPAFVQVPFREPQRW